MLKVIINIKQKLRIISFLKGFPEFVFSVIGWITHNSVLSRCKWQTS